MSDSTVITRPSLERSPAVDADRHGADGLSISTPASPPAAPSHWALRYALRFCAVYFPLYVLTTQMLTSLVVLPLPVVPNLGMLPPVTWIVEWVAANLFGASLPLVIQGSGSGDKMFNWVHACILLVLATLVAAVWTWHSRASTDLRLHQRLHLFTRFALGSTLVTYGAVKAFPLQMPFPSLNRLLERYGDFSPMGVLWASIGASPAYESFTGAVELLAGLLLFIPATATLGALTALAATEQIFTLNMTYDVPVKLFSFHLIVMAVFLLAVDARRLLNVLVLNRIADVSSLPRFGHTPRAMRVATIVQIVLGVYLVGMGLSRSAQSWTANQGASARSPLYGIWDIERMAIDGVERAPLVTDYDRWRRVTFDRPTAMSFHRMDDTVLGYVVTIDEAGKTIALTKAHDAAWKAMLTYEPGGDGQMTLRGELDGHRLDMHLRAVDRDKFLLVTRGFRWVQEYPFNR
jgi:hypothetical protein